AMEAVEPVIVTIEAGELIVPAGQRVGPRELETLEAAGFDQPEFSLVDDLLVPVMLVLLTTIIIGVYLVQYTPRVLTDTKRLVLLMFLLLVFIGIAKFMVIDSTIISYLYPIAAFAMLIAILIDAQLAFILTTILALLAGYSASEGTVGTVIFLILSGWTGALTLGRGQRFNSLIWASVQVAIVNTAVILVFNVSQQDSAVDTTNLGLLVLAGILNGIFSAGLAAFGLFLIGHLFGITTFIQLLDLARPTQPLLRQLLLKASGTYHHSLMVSNLAEQAAERLGADALLVRVMAYYHDIGKMQRPYFFIENQPEGMTNVHEKLDPQVSAQIIINHVTDGLDLARKYRLPRAIRDGIAQHHGTGLVRFFYYQALEAAKESEAEVDETKFRYPGPKPQSKENGILMLADVSETTVRALKPSSAEEIDEIVRKSVAHHLESGQLDESDLTISDLRKIRTAFVDILQGVHHPRIRYPGQEEAGTEKEDEETSGEEQTQAAEPGDTESQPVASSQPLNNAVSSSNPSSRPTRLVQRE
ncbi:MAG: HDIG domain-containing protein, partial [Anaerolineae bacterium]|nr:HDIG domain-containing protein [Anaerolineae bacterium]